MRKLKVIAALKVFTTATTDIPLYDNMLRNPSYFIRNKGVKSIEVIFMSRDDYFFVLKQFGCGPDVMSRDIIENYAEKMKQGEKFPMPVLEILSEDDLNQEGRHRIEAAHKIGVREFPVLVVKYIDWEI